ncbi:aldo/keto reductase [candidate division KSB1 bacterium]|nr:aldo/keto reductase [candidate division KSB1 bacterium]
MKPFKEYTRRRFIKTTSGFAAGMGMLSCAKKGADPSDKPVEGQLPKRPLGKTGISVSMLSFGGGSQFMANANGVWEPLLERALALGINFYDTSIDYNGSEERYAEILAPIRQNVYICSKFNGMKDNCRDAEVMKQELATSLARLKTDYLDVYMLHSVDANDDVKTCAPVFEEMLKLKDQGVIKHLGFSSMDSAEKSRDFIVNFDFDVCMLAINPTRYGNYEEIAMPEAIKKNMGVFAMKVMRDVVGVNGATAEVLLAWALDRDGIASAVIGHKGLDVLEQNAQLTLQYTPNELSKQQRDLEDRLRPLAGPHALCWAHPSYRDVA